MLRSGVKGPLMWGSSSERLMTTSSSYSAPESAIRRLCGLADAAMAAAWSAIEPRWVDCKVWAVRRGCEREERSRRPNLSSHVANRRHPRATQTLHPRPVILNNIPCTPPNRKSPSKVQNNILRTRPPAQPPLQPHPPHLRRLQLPRRIHQRIHSIRAPHANRYRSQPPRIRRMTIRPQHHQPRRRVILKHSLMYNPRPRRPKLNPILLRRALQKVINLLIPLDTLRQIHIRAPLADDHVVAVYTRRHGSSG